MSEQNKPKKEKFDAYTILKNVPKLCTQNYLYTSEGMYYEYLPYEDEYDKNKPYGFWDEMPQVYIEKRMTEYFYHPKKHQINELLKAFQMLFLIPKGKAMNVNKGLIPMKNGIYNIQNDTLYDFKKEFYMTYQLPIKYNPKAKCERFIQFLHEVLPNKDEIKVLQEYIGLCFTTLTKYEKCLILTGSGANGKSTLLDTITKLFENTMSTVPLNKLESDYHRAMLKDKLVNISNELDIGELVKTDYFNSILSGNRIEARRPYFPPMEFNPFCKMILAMNDLPKIKSKNKAFYRRLMILNFTKTFDHKNMDINLKQKLRTPESLEGIFIWAMEGLKRLEENESFTKSFSIDDALKHFIKENNPIYFYVKDNTYRDEMRTIPKDTLYLDYKDYSIKYGYKPYSKNVFYREIQKIIESIDFKSEVIHGIDLIANKVEPKYGGF